MKVMEFGCSFEMNERQCINLKKHGRNSKLRVYAITMLANNFILTSITINVLVQKVYQTKLKYVPTTYNTMCPRIPELKD